MDIIARMEARQVELEELSQNESRIVKELFQEFEVLGQLLDKIGA